MWNVHRELATISRFSGWKSSYQKW